MDHIAIMKKSLGLMPKIFSGEKTIESRWYKTKRAPWDRVKPGDIVYFKNAGEPVVLSAVVLEVLQFEINNIYEAKRIVEKYGNEIFLLNKNVKTWPILPKYCILMRLKDPKLLQKPFSINKSGFGIGCAWIIVDNIDSIKK